MHWIEAWKDAHDSSPLTVRPENESKWEKYWSICSKRYLEQTKCVAYAAEIADYLQESGNVKASDSVLDIGCGPGTYSIPLARKAGRVRCIDSSEGMLNHLAEYSGFLGLNNVECELNRWEDSDAAGFDFALCSMSPAVRDYEMLLKMEASANRCCYITTYSDQSGPPAHGLRNRLWEQVFGGPMAVVSAYDVKYPLNILLERGISPEIKMIHASSSSSMTSDEAFDEYVAHFSIFTEMDDEKKEIVRRFISENEEGGILRQESKYVLAVMTWDSPPKG